MIDVQATTTTDGGAMEYRFASLLHPDTTGYLVSTDSTAYWDQAYRAVGPLCTWAAKYDTYGHGTVQHAPERVLTRPDFEDFCASLADAALRDPELAARVAARWEHEESDRRILFLGGLRYDGKKTRYYNRRDMKASAADTRRHDKRWEPVPDFADGGVPAVYRMLVQGEHRMGLLGDYALYNRCREVLNRHLDTYAGADPAEYFDIDRQDRWTVHQAYLALVGVVDAAVARRGAETQLDCWRNNTESRRRAAEAPPAEDSAA
jgi:hypothetical protein